MVEEKWHSTLFIIKKEEKEKSGIVGLVNLVR